MKLSETLNTYIALFAMNFRINNLKISIILPGFFKWKSALISKIKVIHTHCLLELPQPFFVEGKIVGSARLALQLSGSNEMINI